MNEVRFTNQYKLSIDLVCNESELITWVCKKIGITEKRTINEPRKKSD